MNRLGLNRKLIAQWAAVCVLSAFSFTVFVAACHWYGGYGFILAETVIEFLVILLVIILIGGVIYTKIRIENRNENKSRSEQLDNRILMIGYDLPEARKGLKEIAITSTVILPLFSFLVVLAAWKYGNAPWYSSIIIAGVVEIFFIFHIILYWYVSRKHAGCRWHVESDGVRYETPHREPVVIKWNEIEKIKQLPLTLRKGNETFSLPCIYGLIDKQAEGNRNIQRRICHRFAFDDVSIKLKAPFKLFLGYFVIISTLLIITIGWMALISQTSYDAGLMVVPLFMIMTFACAYTVIKHLCWLKPIDKGEREK